MIPKQYFVPRESHVRTLRGLASVVGAQLDRLFWQKPALPGRELFSSAAQGNQSLLFLPVGICVPCEAFASSPSLSYSAPAHEDSSRTSMWTSPPSPGPPKKKKSNHKVNKQEGIENVICFWVNSRLADSHKSASFLHLVTPNILHTCRDSWRMSSLRRGLRPSVWGWKWRVGMLERDLGVPASNAWTLFSELQYPRLELGKEDPGASRSHLRLQCI